MTGLLAIVAGGYMLLLAGVYAFQSHLVFFPGMDRENRATPATLGLRYEELMLETRDGEQLAAWFVPAENPRGTALLFHGNAGSIAHRLDWLPMFRRLGLNAMLVEYRGYGRSTGSPSEEGTYRDAEAAWSHLTGERAIPPREVVLVGESLGGAVAVWLASREMPGAVVLLSCFTSVPDLAAQLYPWLPARWLARIRYPTIDRLPSVGAAVLVAHSPTDEIIPFAHGRRLFETAREPKVFLALAGGHNEAFFFVDPAWEQALREFLDTNLPGRVSSTR